MGSLRVGHDWAFSLPCIGEGNGSHLAWRIPCTEEPGYSPRGPKESDRTEWLTLTSKHQLNSHEVSEYRAWPWGFRSQGPSLNCSLPASGEEQTRRGGCKGPEGWAQPAVRGGTRKLSWGREAETRAAFARRGRRCVSGLRVASAMGRGGGRGLGWALGSGARLRVRENHTRTD